jgi:hypothetical protein
MRQFRSKVLKSGKNAPKSVFLWVLSYGYY